MEIIMKYLIIGAGGTGGILGAYMTKAGKDVTLIARNAHLAAMKEDGLTLRHLWDELWRQFRSGQKIWNLMRKRSRQQGRKKSRM